MTDVVVFIDALSPRELSGYLEKTYQGDMDSGVPRVTPRVMSSLYTGLDPAENGMLEISKHGGEMTTRPKKSTFIDQAVREGLSVLSMGMPFCVPFQVRNNLSLLHGTALHGMQEIVPRNASNLVLVPAPSADMISDDPGAVYSSFLDYTRSYFTRAKELIRRGNFDVAFIGYRLVDSYCHFQHTERMPHHGIDTTLVEAYRGRSGSIERDTMPNRRHLIDNLQYLITELNNLVDGDVMWFSDHGQVELTHVFRINQWLRDAGWLSYKVDYDFIDTLTEYRGGEQHPINQRIENQFTFGEPGVKLIYEESQVVCSDPFDSCLTLLCDRDDFEAETFRDALMSTGMYRSVEYKWELYDEDADFYENIPDIIPDRAEGVFVSGNLHKEPIGMGYYRSGVHDRTACYGGSRDLGVKFVDRPEDMYDVICDFIELDVETSPIPADEIKSWTPTEQSLVAQDINEVLGQ